jgi:hypothetical protein
VCQQAGDIFRIIRLKERDQLGYTGVDGKKTF